MKMTKILIMFFITILMVCGLFLITCRENICIGDGDCYIKANTNAKDWRKWCYDDSCIAAGDKSFIYTSNNRQATCNCYE